MFISIVVELPYLIIGLEKVCNTSLQKRCIVRFLRPPARLDETATLHTISSRKYSDFSCLLTFISKISCLEIEYEIFGEGLPLHEIDFYESSSWKFMKVGLESFMDRL